MWSEPSPAFHRKSAHVETSTIISRVTSHRDRGKMRSLVWWRPRETGFKEDRKVIWTKATARSSKLRMKCMLSVARWKLMETLKRAFLVIWRNRIQVEEKMQSEELETVEYNSCMHSWFSNSFLKRENYHIKCVHLYKEQPTFWKQNNGTGTEKIQYYPLRMIPRDFNSVYFWF